MFYVRTADRLQRTSTWRDNLEGGMDYLKDVSCEDSTRHGRRAGSRHAASVVDTYECEWKNARHDETRPRRTRKRFRHS
jgi:nitrite reductase (NADH) large subunit